MLDQLNPAQREAAATLSGPLLVLAGAGTGKTRVVTYRIAQLIKHGVPPERILAVTFTKKASGEMLERAVKLLGRRQKQKPEISTFHSLCVRILRRRIDRLGYPLKFAIYDRGDQEGVARAALREINVPGETLRPGDLINFISRWKTSSISPRQASAAAQTDKEHLAAMAFWRYQQALKTAGAVDFDDLLLCTGELFAKFPDVLAAEAARFSHLLVDEYQDTNGSQYRIIQALAAGHRNLCVVGDDDQSIYGWRGAEVAHILRFRRDWPDAKVVRLEENYRSTEAILTLANRLIAFNRERHDKVLRAVRPGGEKPRIEQYQDEAAEAREVVGRIRAEVEHDRAQPRDFAILFRTNTQPRAFEAELRRLKLPYVLIGGMSFYDRKEVRDILAYLKLLSHPADEVSLLRVINTPARGIGPKAVRSVMAAAVSAGKPAWSVLPRAGELPQVSETAAAAIITFQRLIGRYRERLEREDLVRVIHDLIDEINYRQELERLYREPADVETRWAAVEEVVNAVADFTRRSKKKRSLAEFLDEVLLGDREDESDKEKQLNRNAVVLMTLHSAKGLEFSQVFMVGMEEGILPHHRSAAADGAAIDEERRLCYVGVTRAEDRLTLSLALSRMKWGKSRPTVPSRFLFELTGKADNPHAAPQPKQTPTSQGRRPARRRASPSPRYGPGRRSKP